MALHGPHQVAQQSRTTGVSAFRILVRKSCLLLCVVSCALDGMGWMDGSGVDLVRVEM